MPFKWHFTTSADYPWSYFIYSYYSFEKKQSLRFHLFLMRWTLLKECIYCLYLQTIRGLCPLPSDKGKICPVVTLPPLLPRLITPRVRDVVFKITSMAITAGCKRTMLNGYRIPHTLSLTPPRVGVTLGGRGRGLWTCVRWYAPTPSHLTRLSRASSHLLFRAVSSCLSSLNRIRKALYV